MTAQDKGEVVTGSWRTAFNYRYLSSEDMEIGAIVHLTITEVTREMAYDRDTKKEKPLISVWFKETERALALNATNAKAITEISGTSKVEKWTGTRIALTKTGETFFGKVGALRVKIPTPKREQPAPPAQQQAQAS